MYQSGGPCWVAGEGSYGQLVRRYGTEGAARVVANLRCVWISHIHADHHAGLPRLLAVRQRLLGPDAPPLPVRTPTPALPPLLTRWKEVAHYYSCA